jgi:hypothetical protein
MTGQHNLGSNIVVGMVATLASKLGKWANAYKPLIAQVHLVEVYRADTHFIEGLYDVYSTAHYFTDGQ